MRTRYAQLSSDRHSSLNNNALLEVYWADLTRGSHGGSSLGREGRGNTADFTCSSHPRPDGQELRLREMAECRCGGSKIEAVF
jgi:hypothetical protein